MKSIFDGYQEFLNSIFQKIANSGVDVSKYELDHIAYRPITSELYNQRKAELQEHGEMIHEIFESNRYISIFRLNTPLVYNNFTIRFFELLGPKEQNKYSEGYQHIEFVIDTSLENFMSDHPTLSFDTGHLNGEINPSVNLEFEDRTGAEFHLKDIGKVVELEKAAISSKLH